VEKRRAGRGRVRVVAATTIRLVSVDGSVVCERCRVAETFLLRLRGLAGRRRLPAGHGVLFPRTRSVHTHFMRFAIDVVFLDDDDTVVDIVPRLRPWRLAASRDARAVLELRAGQADKRRVHVGTKLRRAAA
jgi:uncharacterized membrane protein (UPF0127 family)